MTKYNANEIEFFSHYQPRESKFSKIATTVWTLAVLVVVGGMVAYSVIMTGTN